MWRFGPRDGGRRCSKYDNLRYRLMPYIYSQAWQVTHSGGTLMRALVMDFPQDRTARESRRRVPVRPVTPGLPRHEHGRDDAAGLSARRARPGRTSGPARRVKGGQTIAAPAPIETMPLYVRAGAILPMGPYLQYTAEKPADPIELRVYRGANGAFTLYEDEGDNTTTSAASTRPSP